MGARNVRAAIAWWSHLPGEPYKALIYMAFTSKDADDPPCYWGGHSSIAYALGRRWDVDGDGEHVAALKAAKRAVSVLAREGAITVLRRAAPRRNAAYLVNVTGVRKWAPYGGQKVGPISGDGGQKVGPVRGSESGPQRKEVQEELLLGTTDLGLNPGPSPTTRPRTPEDDGGIQ